jgi:hypothetical protein
MAMEKILNKETVDKLKVCVKRLMCTFDGNGACGLPMYSCSFCGTVSNPDGKWIKPEYLYAWQKGRNQLPYSSQIIINHQDCFGTELMKLLEG